MFEDFFSTYTRLRVGDSSLTF